MDVRDYLQGIVDEFGGRYTISIHKKVGNYNYELLGLDVRHTFFDLSMFPMPESDDATDQIRITFSNSNFESSIIIIPAEFNDILFQSCILEASTVTLNDYAKKTIIEHEPIKPEPFYWKYSFDNQIHILGSRIDTLSEFDEIGIPFGISLINSTIERLHQSNTFPPSLAGLLINKSSITHLGVVRTNTALNQFVLSLDRTREEELILEIASNDLWNLSIQGPVMDDPDKVKLGIKFLNEPRNLHSILFLNVKMEFSYEDAKWLSEIIGEMYRFKLPPSTIMEDRTRAFLRFLGIPSDLDYINAEKLKKW